MIGRWDLVSPSCLVNVFVKKSSAQLLLKFAKFIEQSLAVRCVKFLLFGEDEYQVDRELMSVIDAVNAKYGRQTIRFGRAAKEHKSWQISQSHLSPHYTTDINQILCVRL